MAAPVFGEKVIVITEALTYTTATAFDRNNVLRGGALFVDHLRWYGAAIAANDTVVITDKNGLPITTLTAQAADPDLTINFSEGARRWGQGFKVPTIASGTLEIHIA